MNWKINYSLLCVEIFLHSVEICCTGSGFFSDFAFANQLWPVIIGSKVSVSEFVDSCGMQFMVV